MSYIGCHVSAAGGVVKAPQRAHEFGCEVFQIFSRSPQGGSVPVLSPDIVEQFLAECEKYNQKQWTIHTPYFINFASAKNNIRFGSSTVVREELERGSLIKASYVMTHLGSYKDLGHDEGLPKVIEGLDRVLDGYTGSTRFLIEISAGSGEVIGGTFEGIAEIIHHPKLKAYNIGVCFDTQHAFGSGYDLRDAAAVSATLDQFDKTIGLDRFVISHCNDSMVDLGSHKDRHDHIGDGKIGTEGFRALINEPRLKHVNWYLETEYDKVVEDIKLLKNLRA